FWSAHVRILWTASPNGMPPGRGLMGAFRRSNADHAPGETERGTPGGVAGALLRHAHANACPRGRPEDRHWFSNRAQHDIGRDHGAVALGRRSGVLAVKRVLRID